MNLNLYSIYDTVALVFNKPFTEINDNTAKRAFTKAIQGEANKNDFALYALGSMTDHDGKIVPMENPVRIMTGFDVKQPE